MDGLVAGVGAELGPRFWEPVYALLDEVWPALPARVELAGRLGYPWEGCTHPFAWFEGGRALAHVGVLRHPVRLNGEDRVIAGIHAVCSHPDARGRGLVRRLMEQALRHVDATCDAAKLHTDHPDLYARFGFRVAPVHQFRAARRGSGGSGRVLAPSTAPADAELLRAAWSARVPVSDRFASRDPGWLVAIDAALQRALDARFVAGAGGIVAARLNGRVLFVDDVFADRLDADEVLSWVPWPFDEVVWTFAPDRIDPGAAPEVAPADHGSFMVRGRFDPLGPIGVGALWEH